MVKLPRGMNRERRRLFVMERTEPGIVLCPSFFQLDVIADDANDVRLLLNGFLEITGFGHGWAQSSAGIVSQSGVKRNIAGAECLRKNCGIAELTVNRGGKLGCYVPTLMSC